MIPVFLPWRFDRDHWIRPYAADPTLSYVLFGVQEADADRERRRHDNRLRADGLVLIDTMPDFPPRTFKPWTCASDGVWSKYLQESGPWPVYAKVSAAGWGIVRYAPPRSWPVLAYGPQTGSEGIACVDAAFDVFQWVTA